MESYVNDATMFFAADANDYMEMMEWFKGNSETEYTQIRPLLYPLLIFLPYQLFGAAGIWFLQLIFWIVSINFIYFSVKKLTKKTFLAAIGVLVVLANLSYLAMTMHALTEVTTIFLLSYILYLFTDNISKLLIPKFFTKLMLLFVVLTLIKPLFFVPTIILIGLIFPLFYFKKYLEKPKQFVILVLAILPLLGQMTFVKIKHDHFTVSTIGSHTFKYYYFVEGMSEIEKTPRPEIENRIKDYNTGNQLEYIFSNKKHYYELLFRTIESNIKGLPVFVKMDNKNNEMVSYMLDYNYRTYYVHKFFLILFLPTLLFLLVFKKGSREDILILIALGCLNYYILLTSGISFWQGDRLTLPSIIVSITQYLFTLNLLFEIFQLLWKKFQTKRRTNI